MLVGSKVFAICDTETEYAFRFMEYMSRKKNLMFEIRVFTSVEKLLTFAEKHAPPRGTGPPRKKRHASAPVHL